MAIDLSDNATTDIFGHQQTDRSHFAIESEIQDLKSLVEDVVRKSSGSPVMRGLAKEILIAGLAELYRMES